MIPAPPIATPGSPTVLQSPVTIAAAPPPGTAAPRDDKSLLTVPRSTEVGAVNRENQEAIARRAVEGGGRTDTPHPDLGIASIAGRRGRPPEPAELPAVPSRQSRIQRGTCPRMGIVPPRRHSGGGGHRRRPNRIGDHRAVFDSLLLLRHPKLLPRLPSAKPQDGYLSGATQSTNAFYRRSSTRCRKRSDQRAGPHRSVDGKIVTCHVVRNDTDSVEQALRSFRKSSRAVRGSTNTASSCNCRG